MNYKICAIVAVVFLSINFLNAQTLNQVPYKIAKHYYVKNTIKTDQLKQYKIASKKEFDKVFGAAAVMGKDGIPTKIDFKKEFVIGVVGAETSTATELIPESLLAISKLKAVGKSTLVFQYKTQLGKTNSFTVVPNVIVVVDKKYSGYAVKLKVD